MLLTKKEVFQIKLRGEPIKLDMTEGDNRWAWPGMIEFFCKVDVLKRLPNDEIEVLYEIHAKLLVDNDTETRTMILHVGQILHKPPAGTVTEFNGVRYEH